MREKEREREMDIRERDDIRERERDCFLRKKNLTVATQTSARLRAASNATEEEKEREKKTNEKKLQQIVVRRLIRAPVGDFVEFEVCIKDAAAYIRSKDLSSNNKRRNIIVDSVIIREPILSQLLHVYDGGLANKGN